LNGERDEWDVLICVKCNGMTTIVNIRAVAIEVRTIEVRTKTNIRDDLGNCTELKKDDYRNY